MKVGKDAVLPEEDVVSNSIISPQALLSGCNGIIVDCRFSLGDAGEGKAMYQQGHIPGAHYLDLGEDLSGPVGKHGGRHPLPEPARFATRLAQLGIDRESEVIAYDDSRFAFAARLWWMMKSLGYRAPRLLDGGYQGFLGAGGVASSDIVVASPCEVAYVGSYTGICDITAISSWQEQGLLLVDSREEARYAGREEPIDPLAGHIPGAINRPWQGVTDENGRLRDQNAQRAHWGEASGQRLVVYCGSGVTACVNLFSLSLLGIDDATLYAGSWSDWCSYL